MGRQYRIPITVMTDERGLPTSFTWRGVTRQVSVIGIWHLRDRWWEREAKSDRHYYRVQTPDLQVFEIYRDITSKGLWVLDRVLD
jgi:hypothetical protein